MCSVTNLGFPGAGGGQLELSSLLAHRVKTCLAYYVKDLGWMHAFTALVPLLTFNFCPLGLVADWCLDLLITRWIHKKTK